MTDHELLQEALNQLEHYETKPEFNSNINKTIAALRARLAQPTKIMGPNLEEVLNATGFYKQREWVGLTDDELHALHFELKVQTMGGINTLGMYRILEAKLKEKNHAA